MFEDTRNKVHSALPSRDGRNAHTHELLRVLAAHFLANDISALQALLSSSSRAALDAFRSVHLQNMTIAVHPKTGEVWYPRFFSDMTSLTRSPRLARHIESIRFIQQSREFRNEDISSSNSEDEEKSTVDPEEGRRQIWAIASTFVNSSPNLTSISWETNLGINSNLWRGLSLKSSLKRISLIPSSSPSSIPSVSVAPRINFELINVDSLKMDWEEDPEIWEEGLMEMIGNGGWTMGSGWSDLEEIELANLGQIATKNFASHLQLLANRSTKAPDLRVLKISTAFMDLSFAQAIAEIGAVGNLQYLELSTSGTKFTSEGLRVILEGCISLVSLKIYDFEGRLDKDTWANIEIWPTTLRSLIIEYEDSGNHHSWIHQHLQSLSSLPFSQLQTFALRRKVHPIATLPFLPPGITSPRLQAGHELLDIPPALIDRIVEQGEGLEKVCLDWYGMDVKELERVLKGLRRVRRVEVAVKEAFSKIIALPTAFLNSPDLHTLIITSSPEHNITQLKPSRKPRTSKDLLVDHPNLPLQIKEALSEPDQTIPEIKDIKKLAKRLTALRTLVWTGRGGKGEWIIERDGTSILDIRFVHRSVSVSGLEIYRDCLHGKEDQVVFEEPELTPGQKVVLEIITSTPPTSQRSPLTGHKPLLSNQPSQDDLPELSRTMTGSSSIWSAQTPGSPDTPHSEEISDQLLLSNTRTKSSIVLEMDHHMDKTKSPIVLNISAGRGSDQSRSSHSKKVDSSPISKIASLPVMKPSGPIPSSKSSKQRTNTTSSPSKVSASGNTKKSEPPSASSRSKSSRSSDSVNKKATRKSIASRGDGAESISPKIKKDKESNGIGNGRNRYLIDEDGWTTVFNTAGGGGKSSLRG